MKKKRSSILFWTILIAIAVLGALVTKLVDNSYYYVAVYVVLQYIVLSTAWNILGGYPGYVNFGVAGFFAAGAYTAVVLIKSMGAPMPVLILCGDQAAA